MTDINGRLAIVLHAPPEALVGAVTILEELERGSVNLDRGEISTEGHAVLIGCGFVCGQNYNTQIELLPNTDVDGIISALRFFAARERPVRREKKRNQTAQAD